MTQDPDELRARLACLWQRLGARSTPEADLIRRYSEPGRFYHGVRHLVSCLDTFDEIREHAERPDEVEMAIWYHDAIYDPQRDDNEARSADLVAHDSKRSGLSPRTCQSLHQLVIVTDHRTAPTTCDESLLVDVDLKILSADRSGFDLYEKGVRQEYAWVPPEQFRAGRRQVLQSFLERDQIYRTELFLPFEEKARRNLERALKFLE